MISVACKAPEDMTGAELDDKCAELEAQLAKPVTPANKRRIQEQLNQVLNEQVRRVSEPVSGMTSRELREARDDIGARLQHDRLSPEGRLELEQRLRDVKAEMMARGEVTEVRTRYSA